MIQVNNIRIPLNQTWEFATDSNNIGVKEDWPSVGLPSPTSITIPHTWNIDPLLEEYRGLGWYQYVFQSPTLQDFNRVWLHFEAVYRDATVWINGEKAGGHSNSGYTSFHIEITPYLKTGENRLIVAVDNRNSNTALPITNSFDWADDGGIIRDVMMIVTGEAAIDYMHVEAIPNIAPASLTIASGSVQGEIVLHPPRNMNTDTQSMKVEIEFKHEGNIVWSGEQTAIYPCTRIVLPNIQLDTVYLWHFDHPHLYELTVHIEYNGFVHDEQTLSLGFREFRTDGSQFLLNGEPVRLTGVEWMPGSDPSTGMAESDSEREQWLTLLKHANCVLTRFHWQQDDKLLDWCDRHGILIQEEIPLWQQPDEPGAETITIAKQQLLAMITRHRHHPSVIAWGVGNELNGQLNGQSEQTVQYVKDMRDYALQLDRTRLVNYVSNTVHLNPAIDATGAGNALMWNDYIGTWHGDHDMDQVIATMVEAHPDKPIIVAEFGLCEPAYTGGDPKRLDILLEKYNTYRRFPNIGAFIFFSLNDYRTQMGEDGAGRFRKRVHGAVDVYGNKKPSYTALREICSPIQLNVSRSQNAGELLCHLACSDDLPCYSVSGYSLEVQSLQDDSLVRYDIPAMTPGQTATITVLLQDQTYPLKLTIRRSTGFSILEQQLASE